MDKVEQPRRSTVAVWVLAGLLVAGCSTKEQRLGSDIDSDACRTYKVALDSTGNFFEEDMIKGAAVGAIGGALTGLLIGGDWKGAVAGAVAGAALGAAAGYWQYKQQQTQDQAVLYASVLSDLQAENAQIDKSQLAFDQLVECRKNEANKIRADLKAGRISRDIAQARMNDMRARYQSDIELATLINKNIQERSTNFAFANEQVNPNSSQRLDRLTKQESQRLQQARQRNRPPPASRPTGTPQEKVLAETASNQAKRTNYEKSVTVAQADTGFLTI